MASMHDAASTWFILTCMNYAFAYFRTIGTVIVGVAFVKLLSFLCNLIRRKLQLAAWHVEVVSDDDPRVHPIDTHGVCSDFSTRL